MGLKLPQKRHIAYGLIGLITALILPIAQRPVSYISTYVMTIIVGANATATLVIAFINWKIFFITGKVRTLLIGLAFLFESIVIFSYRLAIHLTSPNELNQIELWGMWHVIFPMLLIAAYLPNRFTEAILWDQQQTKALARKGLFITVAMTALLLASVWFDQRSVGAPYLILEVLPDSILNFFGIIDSIDSNETWTLVLAAAVMLFLVLVNTTCSIISILGSRNRALFDGWVSIATMALLADVVLSAASQDLTSTGWIVGELLALTANGVVLLAILSELTARYKQSESDKEFLESETITLLETSRVALEREDRIRRILKNAADPYLEIDRNGSITQWNEKATELFGISEQEAKGNDICKLVMPKDGVSDLHELIEVFWKEDARFDGGRAEILIQDFENNEVPVEATMWVDESTSAHRMSFFLRDVSVRKKTEEALQDALKEEREAVLRLQELDRTKNDFVSSVSHELRSPLTSTIGYLELLSDGDVGRLSDDQQHTVDVAYRNARRLLSLIEDLLTLSRIDNGSFDVKYRTVQLGTVIQAAVDRFASLAGERSITLTYESGFELGACPGDRDQIERAISNIVSNAIKFTPAGGRVDVVAEQHNGKIAVVISDNGIGIPTEEQESLFKRFYRSQIAIEEQLQGAGLGLTIAHAIVERHGGEIIVDSRLGKGTTVTIILPALMLSTYANNQSDTDKSN